MNISERVWGNIGGREIKLFSLENSTGMCIKFSDYGAIVHSVSVPDKNGKATEIILGYDSLEDYVNDPFYIGAVVGRYANRIANGKVRITEAEYQLTQNQGTDHLHGGAEGFGKKIFDTEIIQNNNECGIRFFYHSPDGEEGYPGNLTFWVTYTLNDDNEWQVSFRAETDKATIVNFTQHAYFNLKGKAGSSIESHLLKINADSFLPCTKDQLPDGNRQPVLQTPFDFTSPKAIGKDIQVTHEQLKIAAGYDHSFVINQSRDNPLREAAILHEPETGISLTVSTTEPSVHLYTGNFLQGDNNTKRSFGKRSGLCLETQHFPDSPNHPDFPNTVLMPGEIFESTTVFNFSAGTQA